jgi:hypothetical protein
MVHPAIKANYYECHVTIEPVFDDRRTAAGSIAKMHHFALAELNMQKRSQDTSERSKDDTFMTGRSYDLVDLSDRMTDLIRHLKHEGFKVWRYKIELTILDSRYDDGFDALDEDRPAKELFPREPVHEQECAEAIG